MRLSSIVLSLVALAVVFLHTQPVMASGFFFSQSGSGATCSQSSPCTLATAIAQSGLATELSCADGSDNSSPTITKTLTIDCAGTAGSLNGVTISSGAIVTLRNLTMWDVGTGVNLQNGTLILENVLIASAGTGILANPTASSTIVVKNSVISGGGTGVYLKPASGGSLSVRLDHVTVTSNTGGGVKIDTTNGPVTVDVAESEISSNGGNGLNAVGGAGGPAMFSIHNSVIAKNGGVGVQANGAAAAAIVDTTLLDSNASGATAIVASGHVYSYLNNRIVGSSGSGFNGTATMQ